MRRSVAQKTETATTWGCIIPRIADVTDRNGSSEQANAPGPQGPKPQGAAGDQGVRGCCPPTHPTRPAPRGDAGRKQFATENKDL